jgi:hypothetical protein
MVSVEYEEISKKLIELEREGVRYYDKNHDNLIVWFNKNPNDSVFIAELLQGLTEISISYQQEFKEKLEILESLTLTLEKVEMAIMYQKFLNYHFIDLDKVMSIIQSTMIDF